MIKIHRCVCVRAYHCASVYATLPFGLFYCTSQTYIYDCVFTNALSLIYKRNVCLLISRNYDSLCAHFFDDAPKTECKFRPPFSPSSCIPRSAVSSIGNGLHLAAAVRVAKRFLRQKNSRTIFKRKLKWNYKRERAVPFSRDSTGVQFRLSVFLRVKPFSDSLFVRSFRIKCQLRACRER